MQLSVPHEAVSELVDLLPKQVGPSVPEVRGHLMMMAALLAPPLLVLPQVLGVASDGHLLQLGERGRGLPLGVILQPQVAAIVPLQIAPPRSAHCAHIRPGGTGAATWTSPTQV